MDTLKTLRGTRSTLKLILALLIAAELGACGGGGGGGSAGSKTLILRRASGQCLAASIAERANQRP
jgi:hypothetical protein